jgi:hypothetical protein
MNLRRPSFRLSANHDAVSAKGSQSSPLVGPRSGFWRDAKINRPEAGSTLGKARPNDIGGTGLRPVAARVSRAAGKVRQDAGEETQRHDSNTPLTKASLSRLISAPVPRTRGCDGSSCRAAFTLVEVMVAAGAGIFLLATAMISFVVFSRALTAAGVYADLDRQSRNTLDIMERDIRQAASLTNWSANGLWFTNTDGNPLIYTFNPTNGIFSFTNGTTGLSAVLLSNCTSFGVSLFQDQPTNGTMVFYPTTTAQTARGIIVSFDCVRTNYAGVTDSETFQTARIVMRN